MAELTLPCGNWGRGWGYGTFNKIGNLTLYPLENHFIWSGYSQGKYGNKWNRGAYVIFTLNDGKVTELEQHGEVPDHATLRAVAERILQNQMK